MTERFVFKIFLGNFQSFAKLSQISSLTQAKLGLAVIITLESSLRATHPTSVKDKDYIS